MINLTLRLTVLTLAVFASFNYNALSQEADIAEQQLTWNGSISSDWENPNNWTPNEVPTNEAEISIPLNVSPPLITGVKTIEDLTISSGASLTVPVGATLNVSGDVTMYSDSNSFASLIVNGTITITGTAKYHRFTNSQSNDNDLIAPPLSGQSWSSFLTSDTNYNESLIFNNGVQPMTTYLFGPFEKGSTDDYLLYDDNSSEVLVSGKGYRSATNTGNGDTLIFTGTIVTGSVTSTIENEMTGVYSEWNLIGNPYPAYIEIDAFLNHVGSVSGVTNLSLLNAQTAAVYGYNANTAGSENNWTIANLASSTTVIAPGQGFFVSSNLPIADLEFTPDMQVAGNADDFILGRSSEQINFVELRMESAANSYETSVYFHDNGSDGLDVGYDAAVFGMNVPDFLLYTQLVQDNEGLPFAIQTLNSNDVNNAIISLGVNAYQGQQVTFSITDMTLPTSVNVYLEDVVANTITLLNDTDYILTPSTALSGTGRFFLRFTSDDAPLLSNTEYDINDLQIYTITSARTLFIKGQLATATTVSLYDIHGRMVTSSVLDASSNVNQLNVSNLNSGVYVVKLSNATQQKTQKVILK